MQVERISAKLQNIGPLIYISLNRKSAYCVILRSSKDFDTCRAGDPKWPCASFHAITLLKPEKITNAGTSFPFEGKATNTAC